MSASHSKYYKLSLCDGLEALDTLNHNTSFPFHFHPTFNISIVYKGIFQTRLNDGAANALAGTILITNPGEIHANPFEKDDSVTFFTFYVSAEFLCYCNGGKPVCFNSKVIDDAGLFADLHNLRILLISGQAGQDFESGLINVLGELALKHGSDRIGEENNYTLFENFLKEENFSKFSLEDAARRFGVDKYKFLRLFKFQTGLTPNNYFILKRIEQSKLMLTRGHDLLSVAIDLGFYDTAHFCNHFKKFTGISPVAYTGG
jgi:AraC-like DNA-binding protein